MLYDVSGPGRNQAAISARLAQMTASASLEVLPRTLAKIDDLDTGLPRGGRVYIACIDGTPIEEMIGAARRLTDAGFCAMPHVTARSIPDAQSFRTWMTRYREEAGVTGALVLAGGRRVPAGPFQSSVQLLDSGIFDRLGFDRLHVAGHPEANRDIDPDDTARNALAALDWKQAYSERTDAEMAIVTQFLFDARSLGSWAATIRQRGVTLPIHVGLAGPARLATLIRYAIACGVGPSLQVLQKRARDLRKLARPFEPTELARDIARMSVERPDLGLEQVHVFPLGGIATSADWIETARRRG
ncbi:methylenetetrahydrofolate reductase [Pseudooceanicola sp. 216_PA32_1]|uniref:Methylenetetrahydrofolate reductase n=2 Tax=Pseudooceanicola pacificus TaxID=2676438 RepID=A0A844WBP0_9RHOB|nr:methylenetetrahydrofolate reductase [Pseudooceanicola pacificus]